MKAAAATAALTVALACAPARAETLTDSLGHPVEVPAAAARVVPAGAPAQVLLHALAPGRLAGLVEPFAPDHAIYVDDDVKRLPRIPALARTAAPGDVAAVAALHPGLVVDYGSTSSRYAAADARIGADLKVPAVLFSGDLDKAADTARRLGRALGLAERGDEVAATVEIVLGAVKPVAGLPDAERVPVYLARGSDGLDAARAGTSFDEAIRLAGGRNVVGGGEGGGTFRRLSVDAVRALKPAVVIVSDTEALHGALRAALPADTRFVLDAGEPYHVLTGPPSLNRLAGVLALAALLHPDKVKADPDVVTRIETRLFPIPPGLSEPAPLQPR